MNRVVPGVFFLILLNACSVGKQISREAKTTLFNTPVLSNAHTGISLFEPEKNKYWYNHQGDKYFVPASNVKIATCYAAMKYLGNRLKGLKYDENGEVTIAEATGDPTLLHPDFSNHPVFDFMRTKKHILINTENWKTTSLGKGWSWDDYNDTYMTERSPLPLYGNVASFINVGSPTTNQLVASPSFFTDSLIKALDFTDQVNLFLVEREREANQFLIKPSEENFSSKKIPFVTKGFELSRKLLRDTLKTDIRTSYYQLSGSKTIYSHPADSVLKPMMHRSDNFFAEQLLLMASNEALGEMNEDRLIDTLLKNDFSDLPQQPRWVDGSGLSRYNLFTPQDFVGILNKLKNEQTFGRLKAIFPTGNEGTLQNYFVTDSTYIYAKTGSLSGIVCLSGYLYTKKNKLLLFSILVNNHQSTTTEVRRAIEKFLKNIRNKY